MKKPNKSVITNKEDREKNTLPADKRLPPDFRSKILAFLREIEEEKKNKK